MTDGVARLLLSCTDRPGIVAAVSRFLAARDANIVESDQHSSDPDGGTFFMRVEFKLAHGDRDEAAFERAFAAEVAGPLRADCQLSFAARPKRVAILVSRHDHCLAELLWRWRRGELYADIPLVVSNHRDLRDVAARDGVAFEHVPVERST
jgi:formyltetrahydrofolate deformylase